MSRGDQAQGGIEIGRDYPAPIVAHAVARQVTLEMYGKARA